MPAKNTIKQYSEDGIFHVYNRGINKGNIFLDELDCKMFLHFLKLYLTDPTLLGSDPNKAQSRVVRKNFDGVIDLLCYCLMPNHFHLVLKQNTANGITEFMRCIITNYVMYFNKQHDRMGPLFQGKLKAVLVDEDSYLIHLSKYVHANPTKLFAKTDLGDVNLADYDYSSYAEYIGIRNAKWVKPQFILSVFANSDGIGQKDMARYKEFVKHYQEEKEKLFLGNLILED